MSDEELADSKKWIARAMWLTVLSTAVALAVLAIDQGIKRAVLEEVAQARHILDEFKRVAKEAGHVGVPEAGSAGSGPVGGVSPGGDVVHDSPNGAVLDAAADAELAAPAGRKTGVARGASGDGRRAGGAGPGKVSRRVPPEPPA